MRLNRRHGVFCRVQDFSFPIRSSSFSTLLPPLYRYIVGGNVYRGYREGLKAFGPVHIGVRALGVKGYAADAVTPHASLLALSILPDAVLNNLRQLQERYPIYGEYGFYDAVDPRTGRVAHKYLSLDQAMILASLANYLQNHAIQKRFSADPLLQKALPLLNLENFLD